VSEKDTISGVETNFQNANFVVFADVSFRIQFFLEYDAA